MLFVELVQMYFRGWVDWFRMVMKEGIKRDIQERKARQMQMREEMMAKRIEHMRAMQHAMLAKEAAAAKPRRTQSTTGSRPPLRPADAVAPLPEVPGARCKGE